MGGYWNPVDPADLQVGDRLRADYAGGEVVEFVVEDLDDTYVMGGGAQMLRSGRAYERFTPVEGMETEEPAWPAKLAFWAQGLVLSMFNTARGDGPTWAATQNAGRAPWRESLFGSLEIMRADLADQARDEHRFDTGGLYNGQSHSVGWCSCGWASPAGSPDAAVAAWGDHLIETLLDPLDRDDDDKEAR